MAEEVTEILTVVAAVVIQEVVVVLLIPIMEEEEVRSPRSRTGQRIVVPDDLEVLPVPRRPRIRHVYPIERMVSVPVARESNPHRHVDHLWRAAAMPRVRKTHRAFIEL